MKKKEHQGLSLVYIVLIKNKEHEGQSLMFFLYKILIHQIISFCRVGEEQYSDSSDS